jgi:NAD(P)-dependent dehydrogenase (short-subunit alcohol dehydrogenase family)
MGRFGDPSELAGAAVYLASEKAASFVTGSDIVVDGGFLSTTI